MAMSKLFDETLMTRLDRHMWVNTTRGYLEK